MPVISGSEAFDWAEKGKKALLAFNAITIEQAEGIVWGAEALRVPFVLQLSQNAIKFHRNPGPIASALRSLAESSTAPTVLHLDHVTDDDLAHQTAQLAFGSVMWDSSHHDYDTNVRQTQEVVALAHSENIWVESELGEIGGKDGAHAPGVRTNPLEAAAFAQHTGIDALAVAVGSSHAMTEKSARLDIDLIAEIAQAVSVPLVLHGSSGVPDGALVAARDAGMRKINIGTALSVAYTDSIRHELAKNPQIVDPRKYLAATRDRVAANVSHYMNLLSV